MAKSQPVSQSVKQEIINQVKQGIPVSQLAQQNGIIPNTIYNWLSGRGLGVGGRSKETTDDSQQLALRTKTNDALTIARLVREKQELTEIIGKFAIQIEKLNSIDCKKNSILEQVKILIGNGGCNANGNYSNCKFNITSICKKFKVARSSLYYKSKLDQSDFNQELIPLITQLQTHHPCYGAGRIQLALKLNYEITINLKKVIRLRHKLNLTATTRKKRLTTRDRKLEDQSTIIPNHFKTTFGDGSPNLLTAPNQIWVADFTYLWIPQLCQFLYVSTILDAFTREALAVKTSFNHNVSLVLQTLQLAILTYKTPSYFHSDQSEKWRSGSPRLEPRHDRSEYQSGEFKAYLKDHNIIQSFPAKASPWQNGRQESFYNNFKLELLNPSNYVQQTTKTTHNQLSYTAKTTLSQIEEQISQQIFYYNHQRIHTSIRTYPHLKRLEFES